jgi:hypothetical protein
MARTYYTQILSWDWSGIVAAAKTEAKQHLDYADSRNCTDGCSNEGHDGSTYLGSVMSLTPSGKFYMPWTTNQTNDDVDRDSRWFEALEKAAIKFDGWVEAGEGDPTDLYFMRYWPIEDLA